MPDELEILIPARRGEWTILPQLVCAVTGTVYHQKCIVGADRTEYPCCDLTIVIEDLDA